MNRLIRSAILVLVLALLAGLWPAAHARAQDFGISLEGMTPEQVRTFLDVARQVECPCPSCKGLSLLECRMTKPQCGTSKRPLALAVQLIRAGQSEAEVIDALTHPSSPTLRSAPEEKPAPKQAEKPAPAPSIDPVSMKVGDSPTLGPDEAKVTVFTFSDFQ